MIFQLLVKLDTLISMSFSEIEISEFFSAILVYFHHGNFLTFLPPFSDIFTHGSIFRHFFFPETKKYRIFKKFSDIFTCNRTRDLLDIMRPTDQSMQKLSFMVINATTNTSKQGYIRKKSRKNTQKICFSLSSTYAIKFNSTISWRYLSSFAFHLKKIVFEIRPLLKLFWKSIHRTTQLRFLSDLQSSKSENHNFTKITNFEAQFSQFRFCVGSQFHNIHIFYNFSFTTIIGIMNNP